MAQTPVGPGTVLAGRFTLDDLLDDTEGARFWRATDQTLARSVAVHVLSESDPRAEALLIAARTSALVSDGHLLRVLDAAAEDGVVYVVNEWGSGVSLDRMLTEGPLSPRRAAWVVKEVAEAIATAHRNGVAHGRLLPENVMITEAGSVKLIGFVVDAVIRSQGGRVHRRVTGGEPMSAHESDVVNLAALLYAALVGRWPGTVGSTVPDAPAEHGRPLRPRQVRAGVPRPLDAICERVLNAGPHNHAVPIETAHEVYAALSDYIGDPTGAPQFEPTALLDADDLGVTPAGIDEATQLHPAAQPAPRGGTDTDTGDLAATGAFPPPGSSDVEDEETQAGVPVFFDEDTGVGWTGQQWSRGLRSDGTDANDGVESSPSGWGDAEPTRRTPAPPPALPDEPERPLFADGPGRRGTATSVEGTGRSGTPDTGWFRRAETGDPGFAGRSTGPGNGPMPAAWGPDADAPADDPVWHGAGDEKPPGRSWLWLAAVVATVVVLIVGVVFAFNLGRGAGEGETPADASPSGSASPSAASAGTPVKIAGVSDFDPQGDPPEENPELAPLAIDGKPSTAWQTSTYYDPLDQLKSGVGLLVDLGRSTEVGKVRLTLMGSPTGVQVLAAPDAQTAPSSTDGLEKVAADGAAGTRADLALAKPVKTQWLVVWLTSLPEAPRGFQGRVAEITISS